MMLPILISVSVAPGSYFFCALAVLATATASSPANATDVAWLKIRSCIIVLPDVLAGAHAVFIVKPLGEPSDRMQQSQYARSGSCCQPDGCRFHRRQFPRSGTMVPRCGSNRCQMKRATGVNYADALKGSCQR